MIARGVSPHNKEGKKVTERIVETNQYAGSNLNGISKRHTCGQRSSTAAYSKGRALACFSPIRICYMFLVGESDLDLFVTLTCQKNATRRWRLLVIKPVWPQSLSDFADAWSPVAFFLQVPKLCTYLDRTLVYIMISQTMANLHGKI